MPHHLFYNPPALAGSTFETLLASFQPLIHRIKITPPTSDKGFRWRFDMVAGSGISLIRSKYSADWSLASETDEECLKVAFLTSGNGDAIVGKTTLQRTHSTALLSASPSLQHYGMRAIDGDYANTLLRFDAAAVSRVLTSMFGGTTLSKLDLAPAFDLSTDVGRTFNLLAQSIVSGMHGARVLERSPKAMALFSETALRLIFENVPHRLSHRLDRELLEIAPWHTHRAIDYMHANMHRPLTVIDIAEAVGVSLRSLQAGFQQFKDTTPAAYLRRIRLQTTHAELSSPENQLAVSEVALKWGFAQMGRFAAQYRAMFGEYPSETARHARRRD